MRSKAPAANENKIKLERAATTLGLVLVDRKVGVGPKPLYGISG